MKITVVSDTHGNYRCLKQVVDDNRDSDLFIHLGDGMREIRGIIQENPDLEIIYVQGNNDLHPHITECVVEKAGYKIFCSHGHKYNIYFGLDRIISRAKSLDCDIVLYGHTHIHHNDCVDGVYVMNPGSPCEPRSGNKPTYGTITISDGAVRMEIAEYAVP
jgi:hypothetical protein